MGQIIQLPLAAAPYPSRSSALGTAECVLLIAVRWWVACYRKGEDPIPRLEQGLEIAGCRDAASAVDGLMATVARTARRQLSIHCPRCPGLSMDEAQLLHAVNLTQVGEPPAAEAFLREAMLSAMGAEFAVGHLEGIAELFAQMRLVFRPRQPPSADQVAHAPVEAWTPSVSPATIH